MYCQKCRAPLKLDGSLEDLNPAAYDLLVATHSQQTPKNPPVSSRTLHPQDRARKAIYEQVARNAGQPTFKRHGGPGRGDMSFIFLTESQITTNNNGLPILHRSPQPLPPTGQPFEEAHAEYDATSESAKDARKNEMERITKLFEILSSRSDIDHPVCVECTDLLVEELQKKLEATTRERDAYVSFLKELQANAPTDEELRAQEEALKKAQADEAAARKEILELEKEKAELDSELLALEEESRQVDAQEEQFWRERNAFASRLAEFQNERDSINSKFDHDSRQLEKLQRSNVYNDTFCISHDGTFATINGLRLGRINNNNPVEWPEINAAWGHALLLLVTVADKLNFTFEGYELQPMGSSSRIVKLETQSPSSSRFGGARASSAPPPPPKRHVFDLFSSGDFPLGFSSFIHRRFDNAQVQFLQLIKMLGAHVHAQTAAEGTPLSLPYPIENDKIGDVSIKIGNMQEDSWAKACKLALTCCKFLLAHASNVNSHSSGRVSG
ncbi:autophagy protein Apg6-domain-containing protein [Podospora fimiseda]|uniref:Autophagy protein Apg6-domain-containing protein n=1 Tax=Podospora fimiseda TaxID=252190 RepID=A0AAN7BZC8_9PEZI|nr:autophagy protein Apg6-domain-containing protein [Podospora fimiseda]